MMATVPHVTSGLGLRKFQADGFLLTRVYIKALGSPFLSMYETFHSCFCFPLSKHPLYINTLHEN